MSLSCFIAAQNDQPTRVQPVNISKPISSRINYSAKGKDSLMIELANFNVPGLAIISCTNCWVDAPWTKAGGGQLEVVVKNQGLVKSKAATIWISYFITTKSYNYWGGYEITKHIKDQKSISPIDPGKTVKFQFFINFGTQSSAQKKGVGVYLTQSGTGFTREMPN